MADKPEKSRPISKPVGSLQINFCKNPACGDFGVPASKHTQSRGGKQGQDNFIVCGNNAYKEFFCRKCEEYIPIKSNQGIFEE